MKLKKLSEIYMMACTSLSAILWLVGLLKMNFLWFVPDSMSSIGAIFVLTIFGFHLIGTFGLVCLPVIFVQKQLKSRQQSGGDSEDV